MDLMTICFCNGPNDLYKCKSLYSILNIPYIGYVNNQSLYSCYINSLDFLPFVTRSRSVYYDIISVIIVDIVHGLIIDNSHSYSFVDFKFFTFGIIT